jgi:hypothetical protein
VEAKIVLYVEVNLIAVDKIINKIIIDVGIYSISDWVDGYQILVLEWLEIVHQ